MKTENVNFKASPEEANEYREISKIIDVPFSQLAREAIREKIALLRQTHPKLKEQTEPALAE